MYKDELFETALNESKEQSYQELKVEVRDMESLINKLLTQILECSTSISERDFNVCGV